MNQSSLHHLRRVHARDFFALKTDRTTEGFVKCRNIVVERRLANAIAAKHCHNFASAHRQIDATQNFDLAIARVQITNFKHALLLALDLAFDLQHRGPGKPQSLRGCSPPLVVYPLQ